MKNWYVYLVRAENNALYCGMSDDPVARFNKHQNGQGARFFAISRACALVYVECTGVLKGDALRRERAIKKLSKQAKEALVQGYQAALS